MLHHELYIPDRDFQIVKKKMHTKPNERGVHCKSDRVIRDTLLRNKNYYDTEDIPIDGVWPE